MNTRYPRPAQNHRRDISLIKYARYPKPETIRYAIQVLENEANFPWSLSWAHTGTETVSKREVRADALKNLAKARRVLEKVENENLEY